MNLSSIFDPFRLLVIFMPGPAGYGIRRVLGKTYLKSLGKNCILDVGLSITNGKNVSVGDYTWIDAHITLNADLAPIVIGKRIHIAPFSVLDASAGKIEIRDYVAIGAGCKIGESTSFGSQDRKQGAITLEKDALIGANSVIYPGVTVGEGAVVVAGSVITEDVPSWSIAVGKPPRLIGKRDKVRMPEL